MAASQMQPDSGCAVDPKWEDPIVAEVRKARQKIFARFNYDLEAYVAHLQEMERQDRERGVRYIDAPLPKVKRPKPDAA
jgi:hypothetical protein